MKKKVGIILLGGTIASIEKQDGKVEVMDLGDYVKTLDEIGKIAEITVNGFKQLGGYETKISDIVQLAKEIKRVITEDQPDGIVVVMGTNVMEEIAFSLNVLVQTDIPLVCTGAMRTPDMRSADGPGNIISAIQVAISNNCRDLGVLVVFNDEIHSADYVRKMHPINPGAFRSEFPLGYVAEGIPSIRVKPVRRSLPWISIKTEPVDVLLYSTYVGDTGMILEKVLELGYAGLVVEGTGGGSVAEWVLDRMEKIIAKIPVVISSRIGAGDVMTSSYGDGYGTPTYLVEHGYLISGQLDGRKARMLLTFLLMSKCSIEEIDKTFRMYSKFFNAH